MIILISGTPEIIKNYNDDLKWHLDHNYKLMQDKEILSQIKNIVKKNSLHKYKKYKRKYLEIKN
ncbi:MAG: hypothetical protein Hyperionvirus6_72 [Hyperionvirus sp.]|uniref:Uncharacterized protein n=1 Tax=Hyperionvirus sp. TaxID=2487770 RepID=A0A3G5AAZ5_9VIRU|nr:MAG: hypothetical protein Hyperionvirus6_72 [Hyperionvirus sp.]